VNSERAFSALRSRFPTWDGLAAARENEVADAIRSGGLANTKAPRILAVLAEIRRRQGDLDLTWMHEADDDEVVRYLADLPGVGPKTVACVLAFSLGRAAIPVDTHVHRVAGRLGFLPPRTDPARAHRVLEELIPAPLRVPMHVGMIRLGRTQCRPGVPLCEECPLNQLCPTAPIVLGGASKAMRRGRGT
jgi:endonuclease III